MEELLNKINEELHIENSNNIFQKENNDKVEERLTLQTNIPIDDISVDKRILSPLRYFMTSAGKNFRQDLIVGLNYWIKGPEDVINVVSQFAYLIHNIGLIVDDVQDGSVLRRGQPCVHLVYGIANAMNTIHYLLANCNILVMSLKNADFTKILFETGMEVIRGQTMEVYWRNNSICPTEHDYKTMVLRKTGGSFFMIQHMLHLYSKANVDLTSLVTALTLFFQINDDYINLWNPSYQKSKGFCEDISEGKFSFPVIYVIRNFPEEGNVIMNILRQQTRDLEVLEHCRSLIEKCGGLEYTKKAAEKYRDMVIQESRKLGSNPVFDECVVNKYVKVGESVLV